MPQRFSPPELEAIQAAVARAEETTSAEIVPCIARQCDPYPEAQWRGVAVGVVVVLAATAALYQWYDGWGLGWLHEGWAVALFVTLGGFVGGLAGRYITPYRRLLIGRDRLAERVHARAEQAFLEEAVFNTRERTGVLLFVAAFEHRVEVLADEGISARVPAEAWGDLCGRLIDGLREGHLAEALVESFAQCGTLLQESGFEIRPDDTNELSNHVRVYG